MNYLMRIPSNFRGAYPIAGKVLLGTAGVCFAMSVYNFFAAGSAIKEVQWRKSQLAKPVYKLSEQEHINPPWNKSNVKDWLYRRVEVTGRVLHRNACLVPTKVNGADGFEYVAPLLVKEDADRSNPQGLVISKGFLPYRFKHPGTRYRIQNANTQTFIGFVSQLQELQNTSLLDGNAYQQRRLKYTSADCEDFAKSTEFINQKQASVAVVQQLHELGNLDERRSERRANGCNLTQNYPYAKTQTGALQLKKMPWEYNNSASNYFWASIASLIVGASVF